jgi:hypothetical protein
MNAFQKEHGCEEAVFLFQGQEKPFACNEPPTFWIGWPLRKEGPYRMCDQHAHHSVKNRGAVNLGPWDEANVAPEMKS